MLGLCVSYYPMHHLEKYRGSCISFWFGVFFEPSLCLSLRRGISWETVFNISDFVSLFYFLLIYLPYGYSIDPLCHKEKKCFFFLFYFSLFRFFQFDFQGTIRVTEGFMCLLAFIGFVCVAFTACFLGVRVLVVWDRVRRIYGTWAWNV